MDNKLLIPNAEQDIGSDTLGYRQPASRWAEALPIGNGGIGAMVFGGTDSESILLSEGICWSGGPSESNNRQGAAYRIPRIRQALLDGELAAAHNAIDHIIGEKHNYCTNLPAGNLSIVYDGVETRPPFHCGLPPPTGTRKGYPYQTINLFRTHPYHFDPSKSTQ